MTLPSNGEVARVTARVKVDPTQAGGGKRYGERRHVGHFPGDWTSLDTETLTVQSSGWFHRPTGDQGQTIVYYAVDAGRQMIRTVVLKEGRVNSERDTGWAVVPDLEAGEDPEPANQDPWLGLS